MRFAIAAVCVAAMLSGAGAVRAEKRLFIVANNPDGYGVDRCLASGESCGTAVANSYCHTHDFSQASSVSKVDRDDITSAAATEGSEACEGLSCNYVAIECTR